MGLFFIFVNFVKMYCILIEVIMKRAKNIKPFLFDKKHIDTTEVKAVNPELLEELYKSDIQQKKFNIFVFFVKTFLFFISFLILQNANINGQIAPFAFAFAFALIMLKENVISVVFSFFCAYIILNFSLQGLVIASCIICSITALYLFSLIIKKELPYWTYPIFLLLGLIGYIYFNVKTNYEVLQTVALIILAVLFLFVSFWICRVVKNRGLFSGLTLDETICLAILIMAFCLGLFDVYIWKFSVSTIVVCFITLCVFRVWGSKYALYFCAIAGFGLAFANNSLDYLAIFCSWAVVIAALGQINRFATCAGIIVIDFLLGAYFNGYVVYTWVKFIDIFVACVCFCCLPNAVWTKIEKKLKVDGYAHYFLNRDRELIRNKLIKMSKIFENMGESYKRVANSETNQIEPCKQVANEVISRLCKNCENYSRCMRDKDMFDDICQLSRAGLDKTKASLLDFTKNIALYCSKTTSLLSSINYAVLNFAKIEKIYQTEDNSRLAIGEQLLGSGKIIEKIAEDFEEQSHACVEKSKIIVEELLAKDIIAKDVLVVEKKKEIVVTLVVKKNENPDLILSILKQIFKLEFQYSEHFCKHYGCKLLEFNLSPKFDVSVGVSSFAKSHDLESGDVYSVVNLDEHKVMFAVCDGMGTGSIARSTSEEILNLVENFYRAGFDSQLILQNISHLLSTSHREVFSTLDICVFDKKNGNVDIIKASAPPSVLKTKDTAVLFETESLPIGIVENEYINGISNNMKMKLLNKGDIMVIASDGVFDAFGSNAEYLDYVNNLQDINMNLLCDNLLEEAKARQGGTAKDDMTVVAFRVL